MPFLIKLTIYGCLFLHNSFVKIYALKHNLNVYYSLTLVRTIDEVTEKYKIDKDLFIAIIFQESSFQLNAQAGNDFGLGQINIRTAKYYCPQLDRLLVDMRYNLDCSARVLSDFRKWYGKKEKNWWTRYNSSNKVYRRAYEKRITKHLEKINGLR